MREGSPERVDQSRIRVHEEPEQPAEAPTRTSSSQQRIRKHTVMGMPAATPPTGTRTPPPAAVPTPPTEISAARSRANKRTPQKTMLGIPRPDFPEPPADPVAEASPAAVSDAPAEPVSEGPSSSASSPSHRARARVRYDSANEPFPVVQRRKKALGGLAVLVLLAGAWLVYRYFSLNG
jgi:hypothetical protein